MFHQTIIHKVIYMESIKDPEDAIAKGIGYPEIFGFMYLQKSVILDLIQNKKKKLNDLLDTKNNKKYIIQLHDMIPYDTDILLSESFSHRNKKYYRGPKIIQEMIQFIESQPEDRLIGPLCLYHQNNKFDLDLCVSGKVEKVDNEYKRNQKVIDKTNQNAIIRELNEEVNANISKLDNTQHKYIVYQKYKSLSIKHIFFTKET